MLLQIVFSSSDERVMCAGSAVKIHAILKDDIGTE